MEIGGRIGGFVIVHSFAAQGASRVDSFGPSSLNALGMSASIAVSCAYGPGNNAKSCSLASLWRAFKSHAIHVQFGNPI